MRVVSLVRYAKLDIQRVYFLRGEEHFKGLFSVMVNDGMPATTVTGVWNGISYFDGIVHWNKTSSSPSCLGQIVKVTHGWLVVVHLHLSRSMKMEKWKYFLSKYSPHLICSLFRLVEMLSIPGARCDPSMTTEIVQDLAGGYRSGQDLLFFVC